MKELNYNHVTYQYSLSDNELSVFDKHVEIGNASIYPCIEQIVINIGSHEFSTEFGKFKNLSSLDIDNLVTTIIELSLNHH